MPGALNHCEGNASRDLSPGTCGVRVGTAPLTYGSVCSGIEAASVAWRPLGWRAAFLSEIEAFPRAVLQHRWPEAPLHGDFTTIRPGEYAPIDLLVGGTPCQSFSVAGLRGGLDDDRGNLALEYLRLADRLRPRWLVWENVPGVLSSAGGRDFGAILGGMVELGYGVAYRVLDAQFFGVAQRRRRVFVVGHLGDWRRATAVLFERHSLQGHPAPRRATPEGTSYAPGFGADGRSGRAGRQEEGRPEAQAFGGGGHCNPTDVATAIGAHPGGRFDLDCETFVAAPLGAKSSGWRGDLDNETYIAHALRGEGFDASEDGTGRGTPIVAVAFNITPSNSNRDYNAREANYAQAVTAAGNRPSARGGDLIAFALRGREGGAMPEVGGDQAGALRAASGGSSRDYVAFGWQNSSRQGASASASASADMTPTLDKSKTPAIAGTVRSHTRPGSNEVGSIVQTSAVRRLTPRECERLQGFPDDYTLIPWRKGMAPDGPRYKALGNSMAVPVMRWIGERIAAVEAIAPTTRAEAA